MEDQDHLIYLDGLWPFGFSIPRESGILLEENALLVTLCFFQQPKILQELFLLFPAHLDLCFMNILDLIKVNILFIEIMLLAVPTAVRESNKILLAKR